MLRQNPFLVLLLSFRASLTFSLLCFNFSLSHSSFIHEISNWSSTLHGKLLPPDLSTLNFPTFEKNFLHLNNHPVFQQLPSSFLPSHEYAFSNWYIYSVSHLSHSTPHCNEGFISASSSISSLSKTPIFNRQVYVQVRVYVCVCVCTFNLSTWEAIETLTQNAQKKDQFFYCSTQSLFISSISS